MTKRTKFKGYELSAHAIGYGVYQEDCCVAAGGILGGGTPANMAEAKSAVRKLIAGTRKPLTRETPAQ